MCMVAWMTRAVISALSFPASYCSNWVANKQTQKLRASRQRRVPWRLGRVQLGSMPHVPWRYCEIGLVSDQAHKHVKNCLIAYL